MSIGTSAYQIRLEPLALAIPIFSLLIAGVVRGLLADQKARSEVGALVDECRDSLLTKGIYREIATLAAMLREKAMWPRAGFLSRNEPGGDPVDAAQRSLESGPFIYGTTVDSLSLKFGDYTRAGRVEKELIDAWQRRGWASALAAVVWVAISLDFITPKFDFPVAYLFVMAIVLAASAGFGLSEWLAARRLVRFLAMLRRGQSGSSSGVDS